MDRLVRPAVALTLALAVPITSGWIPPWTAAVPGVLFGLLVTLPTILFILGVVLERVGGALATWGRWCFEKIVG